MRRRSAPAGLRRGSDCVDAPASYVMRPGSPHVEYVTVEAGQSPAGAPQGEQRALDLAPAEICVVMVSVHSRAGAVVLADRLHDGRVVEHPAVGLHQLRGIPPGRGTEAESTNVEVEEGVWVGRDQPLRQGLGLG